MPARSSTSTSWMAFRSTRSNREIACGLRLSKLEAFGRSRDFKGNNTADANYGIFPGIIVLMDGQQFAPFELKNDRRFLGTF